MRNSVEIFPDLAHLGVIHLAIPHGQFLYLPTLQLQHLALLLNSLLIIQRNNRSHFGLFLKTGLSHNYFLLADHHFIIAVEGDKFT